MKFLIGQRVLLNDEEIGTIVSPERTDMPNTDKQIWVWSPTKKYASYYDSCNVKPLPNNQL